MGADVFIESRPDTTKVGSGALIPLEMCYVPPGQIMRKQVPPEKTKDVLEFSTMKPDDRFQSILRGREVGDPWCFRYYDN